MDIDELLSDRMRSLNLKDYIVSTQEDAIEMETQLLNDISITETDDVIIEKKLIRKTIHSLHLLDQESTYPEVSNNDFVLFLETCKKIIINITIGKIWKIIGDYSSTRKNLLSDVLSINRFKRSNTLSFIANIKYFELIQCDKYTFNPIRIFDLYGKQNKPVANGIFISVLIKYYNHFLRRIGYSNVKIRTKYIGHKNSYIQVDIIFYNNKSS